MGGGAQQVSVRILPVFIPILCRAVVSVEILDPLGKVGAIVGGGAQESVACADGMARAGFGLQALRRTLETSGRTILFSSLTVAAAVASLAIFP